MSIISCNKKHLLTVVASEPDFEKGKNEFLLAGSLWEIWKKKKEEKKRVCVYVNIWILAQIMPTIKQSQFNGRGQLQKAGK